jgi:hypothetical protein
MSESHFPIGRRITLPGHFAEPVALESVRLWGDGCECRVRLADGTLEEGVLSPTEMLAIRGDDGAADAPRYVDTRRYELAAKLANQCDNLLLRTGLYKSGKSLNPKKRVRGDRMPVLYLDDVPAPVYDRIQKLAAAHHRTPEAEALDLLEQGLRVQVAGRSQVELLADLKRRSFAPPPGTPDSVELLREDRGR